MPWWQTEMYIKGMNREAEAANGDDDSGAARQAQDAAVSKAEAAKRFAETGETSLSREPVEADFTGMDALMKGAKRRPAKR